MMSRARARTHQIGACIKCGASADHGHKPGCEFATKQRVKAGLPIGKLHTTTRVKDGDLVFTCSVGTAGEPFVLALSTQAGLVLLDAMNDALDNGAGFKAAGDKELCEEMFDALNAAIVRSK